jgi:hypothetical protein
VKIAVQLYHQDPNSALNAGNQSRRNKTIR